MGNLIHETESFFKTRDKEYQETIGQIEVRAWAVQPPWCSSLRSHGCDPWWLSGSQVVATWVGAAGPGQPQAWESEGLPVPCLALGKPHCF